MSNEVKSLIKQYARNGAVTAKAVLADGTARFLHSSYNPEQEARDWLRRIQLTPDTGYLVLGLGLGYHVKELLAVLPENSHIYIIEPSAETSMISFAQKCLRNSAWMEDPRISYLHNTNIRVLAGIIAPDMRTRVIKQLTVCPYQPFMQLYPQFYNTVSKQLSAKTEELFLINLGFGLTGLELYINNLWKNIPYLATQPGIMGFQDKFKGKPAVVVSAGPSLNKNVHVLKEYADKAVIIASGSAMGALTAKGITPDFLAVLDPWDEMYEVLKDDFQAETALLSLDMGNHKIVANYPGQRFFFAHGLRNIMGNLPEFLPETTHIESNQSVATTAFNFARFIGADPIVFIGQDMAFAPDATHAANVKATTPLDWEDSKYCWVKGQNGELLKTYIGFKELLDYFVAVLTFIKDRTVINATEGGAYMEGAKHMPLHETAEKYFKQSLEKKGSIQAVGKGAQVNYNGLLALLSEVESAIKELIHEKQTLSESSTEVSLEDQEALNRELAKIEGYVDRVKTSKVYPYVKGYLDSMLEMYTYEKKDGTNLSGQCKFASVMLGKIGKVMETIANDIHVSTEELAALQKSGVK